MRRKSVLQKHGIEASSLNLAEWPIVDTNGFTEDRKDKYDQRKLAVEMYLDDTATTSDISEATGLDRKEILRYVERCLQLNQSGEVLGFRALNPNLTIKGYDRESLPNDRATNFSGAFELLLDKFPDVRVLINELALGTKKNSFKGTFPVKYIHKKMITKCKDLEIAHTKYPFNTEDQGRRSLERYIKKLKERHFGNEHVYGENAAMIARTVGRGEKNNVINFRPYGRVMFDGHKIDLILTIRYTDPDGNWRVKTLKRIWLLVILDIPTRNVLGHLLCLKPEYSQMDVLQCIQNAINPHKPMSFTIKGLQYPKEGAFPSSCIPEVEWAAWREIWLDNAKANLAKNVKDKLTKTIGCFINAGPVSSPLRRGFIAF